MYKNRQHGYGQTHEKDYVKLEFRCRITYIQTDRQTNRNDRNSHMTKNKHQKKFFIIVSILIGKKIGG